MRLYGRQRLAASVIAAEGDALVLSEVEACVASTIVPTNFSPDKCPRRGEPWLALLQAVCILLLAVVMMGRAHADEVPIDSPRVTEAQIEEAMSNLSADPNIGAERKQRVLRWKQHTQDNKESKATAASKWWFDTLQWIANLFRWIADSSRMLAWLLIAALVGVLVVLGLRVLRHYRGTTAPVVDPTLPTHVQHFDIRPESLPEDIGAAAWQRWQQQASRDALALLYRGLLSKLVNVHSIPIRASSTEADCLSLCLPRLDSTRLAYTRTLLSQWQQAIYGAKAIDDASIKQLCADFQIMNTPAIDSAQTTGHIMSATS